MTSGSDETKKPLLVRMSNALADHPLRAFLLIGAVLVLTAGSIRKVLIFESRVTILTWLLGVAMAYAVVVLFFLPRRLPPERRLFVSSALALTPALFGSAAALNGSPASMMWIGVAISLGLVAFVLLRHEKS